MKITGVTVLFCLVFAFQLNAQSGFYIPKNATVNFTGDSASIFSDVFHYGNLSLSKNATLNFLGKSWTSDGAAMLTDDLGNVSGEAGTVRFNSDVLQEISGGYNAASKSGPSFYNLQVDNTYGVALLQSNLKVKNELTLTAGHIYLRDNIMVVGDNNPGTIKGFDSSRFFVSGNAAGTGILVREGISKSDGPIVFPIGTAKGAYTPATITSNDDLPDDFYATVFDSVRKNAVQGEMLVAEGVNKTWEIGQRYNSNHSDVDIILQHIQADEGAIYSRQRDASYISQFVADKWDVDTLVIPSVVRLSPPGVIQSRNFVNSVQSTSYFTKLSGVPPAGKIRLWLSAYRETAEHVSVTWQVFPENDISYYVVQRKLSTETDFSTIDTVQINAALSGTYKIPDANNYKGVSYYRLIVVHQQGAITYSKVIPVNNVAGQLVNVVWPNPSKGNIVIGMNNPDAVDRILLFNLSGQVVFQEKVNGRPVVQVSKLFAGVYFVSFIDKKGDKIETKQLQVNK